MITITSLLVLSGQLSAEDASKSAQGMAKHQSGSEKLAVDQDELSADVQELIEEQTNEKVIQLLEEVEETMAEVTYKLDEHETGGKTIAAQTEIIEKIFDAAKEKQKSSGTGQQSQKSMGAMLQMMQRMMGKEPGQQKGQKPGQQSGQGITGDSDAQNSNTKSGSQHPTGERRVPKSAGKAGSNLPPEFQKALDAYNRPPTS